MSHLHPDPLFALSELGDPSADGEFIVATGAGTLAYESGATVQASLGLVIGTDVQAFDATLTSIALLGTAADKMLYTTGVDTWAEADITAFGRSLLDDANAAAARTTLGLVIGTDVQAQDDLLQDIADIAGTFTGADQFIVSTGVGTAALESGATARASLGVAIGTDVQAQDELLQDIADIAGTFTGADQMLVSTGVGTAAIESGNTLRTSIGVGNTDDVTHNSLTVNQLTVIGDPVLLETEKVRVDDNTILMNANYSTASPQDWGIAGVSEGTGTTDTVTAYPSGTTITTSAASTFSGGDYVQLENCGVNNGVYRVITHTANTLTIATTGDDDQLINASLDTSETAFGTVAGVEVAGLRYDASAGNFEFAVAASTGPLVYSTIDAGLLSANNTWTGTQTFQDQITTEAIVRQIVTITGASYTVLGSDWMMYVNNTAAGTTIDIPAATGSKRELVIKRADTSTQSVTVDANGADTIDGDATASLKKKGSLTILDVASGVWAII